ncbi:aliphatic sulfonate ABC transporter substrate-binding protein [Pseudomonas sp. 5P_3.1_Bac2]|uniref:aliphatic sulfonate ABC transporter substrate-binding protein n=1 Tax=Pseudomonas sp. 5P_3.1_Bac2 TaxID=2971617 RepID=UPI0021CA4F11|nr:aliphatic sulfonate ABC transporter substrate-binding protein [Pseudomonas sp. 5P_3.1_Bac2]MCU1719479.1 aliphatic sulfonate ABC transporter substrate-binding protein [Pseudomonas sp. 5P_3.1_Bac2]
MKTLTTAWLLLLFSVCSYCAQAAPAQLRIGFQKGSSALVLAKQHGYLEQRFGDTQIKWIEFPAGPQMLEALNIGSLDIGATGDIPPLFAQAANADLVYIGAEPPKPKAEAILVSKDSLISSVAELKGQRVAVQKGSSSHNVLLRALAKAGVSFSDIEPIYLPPAEARAAFERGSVAAWAIWDPFYAAIELEGKARVLANGEGLGLSGAFYLAARAYAEANPEFIGQVLEIINQAEALTRSDEAASQKLLADFMGLDPQVLARAFSRRPPSPIGPLTPEIVAAQQQTADLFFANRLLPKKLNVSELIWQAKP